MPWFFLEFSLVQKSQGPHKHSGCSKAHLDDLWQCQWSADRGGKSLGWKSLPQKYFENRTWSTPGRIAKASHWPSCWSDGRMVCSLWSKKCSAHLSWVLLAQKTFPAGEGPCIYSLPDSHQQTASVVSNAQKMWGAFVSLGYLCAWFDRHWGWSSISASLVVDSQNKSSKVHPAVLVANRERHGAHERIDVQSRTHNWNKW